MRPAFRSAALTGGLVAIHAGAALAQVTDNSVPAAEGGGLPTMLFGLVIGVVLAAAAYLFFIWAVMRDRGQIFLMIFLICIGANIASFNDLMMQHAGLGEGSGRELMTNLSIVLAWLFGLAFTYHFLELDNNAPGFKTYFVIIGLMLSGILVIAYIRPALVDFVLPPAGFIAITVILIAGLAGIKYDVGGSLVHVVAFICFLGGTMTEPAYILGLLRTPETAHNLNYIAFAMSAITFAIVVAAQFAARQEDKERQLALSNERFMLATKGANEGLFDWNLVTGEVFLSEQFRRIIGIRHGSDGETIRKWARAIIPNDRRAVSEAFRRFRRSAKTDTLNVEYRIVHAHGERRWLHSKAVAMRDRTTRKVLRLVGSTSDITARKQSEVALRASEVRFRSITEAHPVPVLIVSAERGKVLYATPGAETLLGMPVEQLRHETVSRFLPDAELRRAVWRDLVAGGKVDMAETAIVHADGHTIPGGISARRIAYQNETAMVVGLYDLTERKQTEARLAHQQEALQQSEKMAALGGLLAGVAHELNNPLSVVVGQATMLMEGADESKTASRAEKIFKAADRCSRIVKSFLALARRKPPERKPVDLNQVIRGSLELLGYQLRNGSVDIQTILSPQLASVTGDGDQLTQVITNLVLNAAQAMEGWTGPHRITVQTRQAEEGFVEIMVADTGPGVPPDIRTRVFEPFFSTKGAKGGTGVGLAMCLNIVISHGGELSLAETAGGGATFIIRLPASGDSIETGGDAEPAPALPARPFELLLVDDEIELAQTLADLLEPDGHRIDIAINGAIGLDKIRKKNYDAVISDLRMPVMDGPALYAALKAEAPEYMDKIIYVTGDTLSTHVQEFLSTNAVHVIEKPYRLKDIRAALARLVDAKQSMPVPKQESRS